jgi:hypothetical protein
VAAITLIEYWNAMSSSDVADMVGNGLRVIGTLSGLFVGHRLGSSGPSKAEKERQEAEKERRGAEVERKDAANNHTTAEAQREKAEEARRTAEVGREEAVNARQEPEVERQAPEMRPANGEDLA